MSFTYTSYQSANTSLEMEISNAEKNQEEYMFSSDIELGKFLGSIDLITNVFSVVSETVSVYQLHKSSFGIQVLAFSCMSEYTTRFLEFEFDLVSSEDHKVIDFISTKVNPIFSINKAAVELFDQHIFHKLSEIQNQLTDCPLVITGYGLGGYLAILFALWKQHAIDVEESNAYRSSKRPICITFGSPLVGDEALQRAISEHPQWKSNFLNIVAKKDRVASFFTSRSPYKPFGTSLFCTETGRHTAFEDQDAVMAVLDTMASSNVLNMETKDYLNVLNSIGSNVLYREVSELGEFILEQLRIGITLQFREVGVLDDIPNDLIAKIEDLQAKKVNGNMISYDNVKKLNDMKISLTHMEAYMKTTSLKMGYYDSYKNSESEDIVETHKNQLNSYWETFIKEKNRMPQTENAKLRKRWLYGGNNYRRIIEPLDIAEYYKNGKQNYIENRPTRYKLLECWLIEDKKDNNLSYPKKKAASLNEDSCFWAYVEESLISLRDLMNGGGSSGISANIEQRLKENEEKVMRALKDYKVSPYVFVNGSSLMKLWGEYKAYKGSWYPSEFAKFMNNEKHKEYAFEYMLHYLNIVN